MVGILATQHVNNNAFFFLQHVLSRQPIFVE